jgi:bacteriocin biosynthesis cyclodehydratase domain-containing protein
MTQSPGLEGGAGRNRLQLAAGIAVVQRDDHTIQVGVDPSRGVVIQNAPPGTFALLNALSDTPADLGELSRRLAVRLRVSPEPWSAVLRFLSERGLLVEASVPRKAAADPRRRPERTAIAALTGAVGADLALQRRAGSLVVVIGSGRIANASAALLAAAGVGHVHARPERTIRPGDALPTGLLDVDVSSLAFDNAVPGHLGDPPVRADANPQPARTTRSPSRAKQGTTNRADRAALTAMLRRVAPEVRVQSPGSRPPSVVLLAGEGVPDPAVCRDLVADGVPHLAVRWTTTGGVIGPFVLPGRTSCLHCHDLHRADADAGWPSVRLVLGRQAAVPTVVLATRLSSLVVDDVLRFVDGREPHTVDGTLDIDLDAWAVRRRSWRRHPRCHCNEPAASAGNT